MSRIQDPAGTSGDDGEGLRPGWRTVGPEALDDEA